MPSPHAGHFTDLSAKALDAFSKKHATRERGLQISRLVIRLSANAVRAVHRGEYQKAEELIAEARTSLTDSSRQPGHLLCRLLGGRP